MLMGVIKAEMALLRIGLARLGHAMVVCEDSLHLGLPVEHTSNTFSGRTVIPWVLFNTK